MEQKLDDLIHDWNVLGEHEPKPRHRIEFDDETLRDGLQSPSVHDPSLDEKLEILHFMERIGVDSADVGLPGAGPHVQKTVLRLVEEIRDSRMRLTPNCAARTHESDIRPIAEISQKAGVPIEVAAFIGSSPIRQFAEEWQLDWIIGQVVRATTFAVSEGLPVMLVTEDTTRARPEDLEQIYTAAIEAGAGRICIADTVGHATPWGARNLVRFLRAVVEKADPSVRIDWHGHNDRGLAVINSIAALQAGANRVHGCALGIGERVGNTPIDLLMVNLRLMGWIDHDLTALAEYVPYVSKVTRVPFADQYPVFGGDAFRTATGVHAAAIVKAHDKGAEWLADRVYSAVPAAWFGLKQIIEIGPMSGLSNVIYWLTANALPTDEALANKIFEKAKAASRVLTDEELTEAVKEWREANSQAAAS
jgi:2-isopropylmalate synthase